MRKVLDNENGYSLVISIVILMVVMVFSGLLLQTGYSLFASVNKSSSVEQCNIMANSLNRELNYEIIDGNNFPSGYTSTQYGNWLNSELQGSGIDTTHLWQYLRKNLFQPTWPSYSNSPGHTADVAYKEFEVQTDVDQMILKVTLYYEDDGSSGTSNVGRSATLYTIVTCNYLDSAATVKANYTLNVTGEAGTSTSAFGYPINLGEQWQFECNTME